MSIQNVILDLDETIINSIPTDEECDDKIKVFKMHDMEDYYLVFERPNVQKFLDELFSKYNVSVWTAATKLYALFVIEKVILKKDRKLDLILFSNHCDYSSKKYKGGKDLNMIFDVLPDTYTECNTIIVDDQDYVKKVQPDNCYQIKEFKVMKEDSHKDSELMNVLSYLDDKK